MLKTILSVTGRPGLFKLISSGKSMVIVESLTDKKRLPIYSRDKVVSLGDIAMYTETDDVPLRDVLISIKKKENGNIASILPKAKPEELRKYLGEVLPTYDKERIYDSDIKKLISWYNLLITTETDFETTEEEPETAEVETGVSEKTEEPKKEKKVKTTSTPKKTAAPKSERVKKTDAPVKRQSMNSKKG